MEVILPVPHSLRSIVYEQMPCAIGMLHGNIVFVAVRTAHSIAVLLISKHIGCIRRQGAIEGTDASSGLVEQSLIYDSQTAMATLLHTTAGRVLYLEVRRVIAVYLVNAIFLEEKRVAQVGDCTGELAVSTAGCCIAVGGQAHEAVPVLEITQFAGVDLVDHISVEGSTVSASPQAVAGLNHIIHQRHLSGDCDGIGLCGDSIQDTHNYDEVITLCPDRHGAVQVLQLIPLEKKVPVGANNL